MQIRKANLADIKAIQSVCQQTWRATYLDIYTTAYINRIIEEFYSDQRLRQDIQEESPFWNGYWIAEIDGQVRGCVAGGMDEKGHANVYVLYVSPNSQRQGIGHKLLETLTDYQKKNFAAQEQWVSVADDNLIGIPFYEKEGFVFDHRQKNWQDMGEADDLQYRRAI